MDTSGTAAALFPEAMPPALVELLRGKVWCDRAGAYVPIENRARVVLMPRRG